MEKRAIIAVVISLLILIVYQEWLKRFYQTPPPPLPEKKKVEEVIPPSAALPKVQEAPPRAALQPQAAKEIRVETDQYAALFTSQGARLKSFVLKHYRTSTGEGGAPFELVPHPPGAPYPLGIQFQGPAPVNDEALAYSVKGEDLKLRGDARGSLTFQAQAPNGVVITKHFAFTGSRYFFELEVFYQGLEGIPSPVIQLVSAETPQTPERDAPFEGFLALIDNKTKREPLEEIKKGKTYSGPVAWAGFGYTYFLIALLPETQAETQLAVKQSGSAAVMEISGLSGESSAAKKRYTIYMGPKDLDTLKSLGKGLERSIDFGYFGFISVPLLYLLHFSHRFTGSYGVDIILLTVLIKLLMAPLTHKSFVSMKQMQKLQPQMERIKERFKDDREKLNKEIMELYRRNKVNPLGGCLPMVLQIPVFIGLYNALLTPIELRHAPFLWIKDLSRPDWESLPVTVGGWHMGIPILTLLMGASMFVQQWMTPSAGDPNQRRMMMIMPLMFTVMFINFPSGLTIYWLVNNILGIGQQYLINRMVK
ncbi:MAG: membrane protein insertase YidC [Deltaproteobacteria bacterium]|nr:membrane protein insertase YidC [Deltaproteobacteria bacterium]